MAKVSGAGVTAGQQSALTEQTIAGGPVTELQQKVPQPEGTLDDLLAAPQELPEGELPAGAIQEGVEQGLAAEQDVAQQRIPTLKERAADTLSLIHISEPTRPY